MKKVNYINVQHLDNLYLSINGSSKESSKIEKKELLKINKSKESKTEKIKKKIDYIIIIDTLCKIVSSIAGIGLIIILVLILFGIQKIGKLEITNLLTILSVTLVGGLFSIGGLNIFNLQTALKKQNKQYEKLRQSLHKKLDPKIVSSNIVHKGLRHFFIPKKNILLVFGHECPAKIYKSNNSFKDFKCIWEYEKDVKEENISFAQTGSYFKDKFFALGDYGRSGVITIYSISKNISYSFKSINIKIDYLEFSPDGKFLAVASGNTNVCKICIHNLESKENIFIEGNGPIFWSSENNLFFLKNSSTILKWNPNNSIIDNILILKDETIVNYSLNDKFLIYCSKSIDKRIDLKCFDIKRSHSFNIYTDDIKVDSIDLFGEKILISTSFTSKKEPNQLIVFDISGNIVGKCICYSGYGFAYYKKFTSISCNNNIYISTVGQNLSIPIFENFKDLMLVDMRNSINSEQLGNNFVSVHLNKTKETIFLSALNEKGILIVVNVTG